MLKIVIVDDQVIFRESLKFIVEQDSEMKVMGCGGNGKEALRLCDQYRPDLVLMDIMMPEYNGVEGTRLIKEKYKDIKIVILTTFNDEENVSQALKYGADGYILKDIKPEELILTIKGVASGLNIIHKSTFDNVVKQFNETEPTAASVGTENSVIAEFTEREIEMIRLIAAGKSNKEIAAKLFLTEGSVKNIITTMLRKLNLEDRIQLVVLAVKMGLV
ncbi:MAG: response regulator transcription factor [Clostridia bacterium]|nr:response regulator transcription factor [Clostridia bacterium]